MTATVMHSPANTTEYSYDPHFVTAAVGDVVRLQGDRLFMVARSTPSRAVATQILGTKRDVEFEDRASGEKVVVTMNGRNRDESISQVVAREILVVRLGAAGYQTFLAAKQNGTLRDWLTKQPGSEEERNIMAKLKSSLPPRGGLAAQVPGAAEKAEKKTKKAAAEKKGEGSRGALGSLYDQSVVSVIRWAAVKGLDYTQIERALNALKKKDATLTLPQESTIKIQIGRGKAKLLPAGTLTKEQADEFIKLAGEKAPPKVKAEKPTKKGQADKKPAAKKGKKAVAPKPEEPAAPAATEPAPAPEPAPAQA